ncbi:dehydrogenase [Actinomadura roseirufa]|uniref:dehydrogenase n=1 Tax=Actinomadura roseirufa TaxID=2094049 RepID=UPI001041147C|nr:dehydrogenase [Actinomadura roseirufa]
MPTGEPICPTCGQALTGGGLVLMDREEDGKRTCRALWKCEERHLWWVWADRPASALDPCPDTELFVD